MRNLVIVLMLWLPTEALAYPVSTTFGGGNGEIGGWVEPLPDGGLLLLGGTASAGAGGMDLLLIRLDRNRAVTWQRTLGSPADDYPGELKALPDGAILSFASNVVSTKSRAGLVRLDAQGNVRWQVFVSDPIATVLLFAPRVLALPDRFILAGMIANDRLAAPDGWLAAVDLSGRPIWERRFQSSGSDVFTGAAALSNGDIMAVGGTGPRTDAFQGLLATFTPAGDLAWQRVLEGAPTSVVEWAAGPVDGRILLTGWMAESPDHPSDVLAAAVDETGEVLWSSPLGLPGDDFAFVSIPVNADFVVGGIVGSAPGAAEGLVGRIGPDGTWRWARAVGGTAGARVTIARASGSRTLAAGSLAGRLLFDSDLWLVELDASGRAPAACNLVRDITNFAPAVTFSSIPMDASAVSGPMLAAPARLRLADVTLDREVGCDRPPFPPPILPDPPGGTRPLQLDGR